MSGRLTPVRSEFSWFAAWSGLAALAGLGGFIARGPSTGDVITALCVATAIVALPFAWLWFVGIRRLRRSRGESLTGVDREPRRMIVLRTALPLGGLLPSVTMLVFGDASDYDGAFSAVLCGLLVGFAAGAAGFAAVVVRRERRLGARLFYRRRTAFENRWIDQRAFSKKSILLVDAPPDAAV